MTTTKDAITLLKIRVGDVSDRTIALREPKSGKEAEMAYMRESVSKKLAEYIKNKSLRDEERIFPICYLLFDGKITHQKFEI
jgi:integrase/recombinase XerD